MAEVTAAMVKELREATGAGPLDCKKALVEHDGDMQKAMDWLREKGLSKAAKKLGAGRRMNEGIIETYVHFNQRIGVLVEVNCETDFVAATEPFKQFAKDIALHIATMKPQFVNIEDVKPEVVEKEKEMQMRILKDDEKNANKPDNILEKIIEGRMSKFYEEIVLMEQDFFKDDSKKVKDALQGVVAEIGESVQISRFARYELGQDDENDDE